MRVACFRASLPPRGPLAASLWASFLLVASLIPLASLITGCAGGSVAVDLNTIAAIAAPSNTVRVNQTLQLTSNYVAAGLPMTFYVNGIAGGNSEVGTISSTGLYTAPAVVPNPYTIQITSSIAQYPTATPGSVSVQVWNPIPALGAVTPDGFSEGTTTVTVNGSQFVYGAADQLERRIRSHDLCLRHGVGGANRRSQSRHLSADRDQSQSRIGDAPLRFPYGRPRPGGAAPRHQRRHRCPRLQLACLRFDRQRNR